MNRLRRSVSIVGSVFIIAGLVAAVAVKTATSAPAALAATTVAGTDVYGQTTVTSWPSVKSAGMTFVGIQAADGATVINNEYNSQVTGALGQGLYVMPYVFADPLKIAGGAQFTRAWSVINSIAADPYASGGQYLPIALDMESDPAVTSDACYGFTPSQMVNWIKAFFAAEKAKTSAVPVIYTNPNWWKTCTGSTAAFSGDPLWIAGYGVSSPAIPAGWAGYTFWQSSGSASVGGISGLADLDQLQVTPTATTKIGTGGSIQIETLNSLAGQQVSYAAASALPAGVSLTAAGKLSWSSATKVGLHTVAVTPVSNATPAATLIPSSVSATIRVHGTIALPTASRSATAGAPISLKLAASGPDQNAGFAPTLKATGLPAGLSMTSTGAVSGWLTKPGTSAVKVTATDALGGTGSVSFTWTVKAAANSGPAGQVRQVGGSGKCLNDPAGNTATGTRITLWTCNGKSSQRWTVVQDGTLRTGGKCLDTVGNSTASGAKLQLTTCNAANGAQHWLASTDGQLINPQSGKCLDIQAASAANGAQPVIEPCANSASQPNEHWIRPAAAIASGQPGKCLTLVDHSFARLTTCANVAAQHWQARADGTIRSGPECLTGPETTIGSPISADRCDSSKDIITWKLVSAGPIATELKSALSGLCASASGTKLVLATCASTPATTWHVG